MQNNAALPEKTETLSALFNGFVKESGARFPALEGRILLMDVADYKVYGLYGLDRDKIKASDAQLLAHLGAHPLSVYLRKHPEESSRASYDPWSGAAIIFFNDKIDPEVAKIAAEKARERTLHLLDHELGHLGIEDGMYDNPQSPQGLLGENIADAYALLRHYQRFGTNKECCDKYVSPFARASSLIFSGDATHFTTFTLQAVSNARNALKLDTVDAATTARMARSYAQFFTPKPETVKKLKAAFKPVKDAWEKDREAGIEELIKVTLDPASDRDVFRTGETWLRPYLKGSVTFPDGTTPQLSWFEARTLERKLDERMYGLARTAKAARKQEPHRPARPALRRPFTP